MQLSPADKSVLTKFTMVAKKIIYNPERMRTFIKMLGTPQGAVQAVQTVLGAIEQKKQIPPNIAPLLAVNSYMIMLDVAQEATGAQPDPAMIEQVIGTILGEMQKAPAPQQPAQPAAQPPGMLAQMQAGAPA